MDFARFAGTREGLDFALFTFASVIFYGRDGVPPSHFLI
jgi:hypothetical protein